MSSPSNKGLALLILEVSWSANPTITFSSRREKWQPPPARVGLLDSGKADKTAPVGNRPGISVMEMILPATEQT